MSKKNKADIGFAIKHGSVVGAWALVIALLSGLISQAIVENITFIFFSFLVLFVVILAGTIFDIIGIAAAAADEAPLSAQAAKGVFGASHAVALVRNAHSVASFCNDVVGDVCGTLAGAVGVTIVLTIMENASDSSKVAATTVMTAIVASIIVAAKAFGKPLAIQVGTQIIFRCGQVLAWIDRWLPWDVYPTTRKRKQKQRKASRRKARKQGTAYGK